MKKFTVNWVEKLHCSKEVEAESEEEAIVKVKEGLLSNSLQPDSTDGGDLANFDAYAI